MQELLQRIRHGFHWRYEAKVKPRLAHLRIMARWHLARPGKPHTLSRKLIVSVTPFPPRFSPLALALRSLLRQTVTADQTVLWIAHEAMPLLPRNVFDLQRAVLTIYPTDDLRSYKKILPALTGFQEH